MYMPYHEFSASPLTLLTLAQLAQVGPSQGHQLEYIFTCSMTIL